jgi:hypothetical protein
MSQTDDSTTGTPSEHPRVIYRPHELNEREFEFAKAVAEALDDEWRVIVTEDTFYPEEILYRIKADSHTVEFLLLQVSLESHLLDFRLYSARVYEFSEIDDVIYALNQKYGVRDIDEAIHDISLLMHNAIQNNSEGTLFTSLYHSGN